MATHSAATLHRQAVRNGARSRRSSLLMEAHRRAREGHGADSAARDNRSWAQAAR